MRRLIPLAALLVVVACQDTSEPSAPAPSLAAQAEQALERVPMSQAPERVMAGRVLARFAPGVSAPAVAAEYGLAVAETRGGGAFTILRGGVGNERALAARMSGDSRVVWAEPDWLRQTTVDTRLWAFANDGTLRAYFTRGRNKGQPVGSWTPTPDADEDAGGSDVPRDYGAGGSPVLIGSIDTGVEFTHDEFPLGTLKNGRDWYDNDDDPSDSDGHGTHTTGTMVGKTMGVAAAAGANGASTVNVRVLVQRVCGPLGCPTSAIASAIRAAADSGVVAMNLSLGGGSLSSAERDAIAYATGKDALVIASAGNGGTGTVSCPACDARAIAVGATEWQDKLTYYTNWGPGLDLVAPGGQLYSNTTEEGGILSAYLGGTFAYLQGTSMSAPQVTGTAGVVASKTSLRGLALRQRLMRSTEDKGANGYDESFGCGRLNTYRAVTGNPLSTCEDPTATTGEPQPTLTASFTYSCGGSSTCQFDGTSSTGATSYAWTFGDGGTATDEPAPTHTYQSDGSYPVTLTVGDGTTTASSTQTVTCSTRGKKFRCC